MYCFLFSAAPNSHSTCSILLFTAVDCVLKPPCHICDSGNSTCGKPCGLDFVCTVDDNEVSTPRVSQGCYGSGRTGRRIIRNLDLHFSWQGKHSLKLCIYTGNLLPQKGKLWSLTRMYSSRMLTVRCSSRLPRGVSAWRGEVSGWRVFALGGCLPREGVVCPWRGVSARGVCPGRSVLGGNLPPVDRILNTCSWKHYLSATSFADGKNLSTPWW